MKHIPKFKALNKASDAEELVTKSRYGNNIHDKNLVDSVSVEKMDELAEKLNIDLNISTEIKCEICGAKYKKIGFLNAHMKKKHDLNTLEGSPCDLCEENFENSTRLQDHIATCHQIKCPQCDIIFNSTASLKQHLTEHSYVCIVCGKSFEKKWKLNKHVKSHV